LSLPTSIVFPVTMFPFLQGCLSDAERRAPDYVHHAKERVLMEGFLFARFYSDFENPDLFILEDNAVIVRRCGDCVIRGRSSRTFLSAQRKATQKKKAKAESKPRNYGLHELALPIIQRHGCRGDAPKRAACLQPGSKRQIFRNCASKPS
jgi:hypothetical protein